MLNKGDCSAALPLTGEVEDELRFGRCRALLRRRQLLLGEQPIDLSSRAFDILMVLIQACGALVAKDEILSRVWPGIVVEENNLTVHIAALRKALGQDKELIQTVFGRGYRFIGTVTCVATDTVPAAPVSVPAAAAPIARAAERRQLSVVFCDLIGSTALSSRLDPEDMCEVIRAYQDACVNAVSCFEGHIIRYLGDGVLACFGWPKAHEDDAERAVRAALAAVEAVGALVTADGSPLAARAAIATGLVVVGDLIGNGAARDEAVVGETPNLAARLQELAEPGSVVIAEGTRRLLGDLFVYRGLDPAQLKGFAEPVTAYHILGEGAAESRFEAMHVAGLTPLVGRDHDVALLLERWERAKEGDGQVVLLAGEAGIGKSRLVRAVRERLGGEPHTPLSQFCSPYHTNSALHPVIGLLERSAGLRREDPPEHQLDRLEAMLACAIENIRESAPLLADLLAIPGATGRYSLPQLSPQQQKKRTFQVLLDQLAGLAARQPVLALYEDVHWADPTTLELLGWVVDRIQRLPVLVVVTFRPEFVPPWAGYGHVTALSLSRLGRRQSGEMVESVTGGKGLPGEVLDQILARTDGVPLFVEELTKVVIESGLLMDRDDHYELKQPLPPLAVPATLQASLMARLDRLGSVKEVAQVAAVIGREFRHDLLAAVAGVRDHELRDALAQLIEAELIFRRGEPPDGSYAFKHMLVQDAAYQSLLKSWRQQLHGRIATALEEDFAETAAAEPELLAHHFSQAGLVEKAIHYWRQAGELAVRRSAMAEALGHFRHGLKELDRMPEGSERGVRELELQTAIGRVLIVVKGCSAPETGQAYDRARELTGQVDESGRLFPVLYGQFVYRYVRAELREAQGLADQMLRLARQQEDPTLRLVAHRVLGTALFGLGAPHSAQAHLEQALALYDPTQHRALAFHYTADQRVAALSYLSPALFQLGYPDQSLARSREALAEAWEMRHPASLAYALQHACLFYGLRREAEALLEQAETLIVLADQQAFPLFAATGTVARGCALVEQGQFAQGIAELQRGLDALKIEGAELFVPYGLGMLARAHQREGRYHHGINLLSEALARVRTREQRWCEAELYRFQGELLLALPQPDGMNAEACFHKAIAVAREQGARMLELRAVISLTRLWRDQGRRIEAHSRLKPIYSWFTEGFDTADLQDAKILLDELEQTPTSSTLLPGGADSSVG